MKRLLCILWLLFAVSAMAGDVPLQWDANTEDGVSYKVYYRLESETAWRTPILVTATSHTFTGLAPGVYVFAVSAVVGTQESELSYELKKKVAVAPVKAFRSPGDPQ